MSDASPGLTPGPSATEPAYPAGVTSRSLVRRVRALLGVGITWGAVWATLGSAAYLVIARAHPPSVGEGETLALAAGTLGLAGFVSGVGFGLALSLAEARRPLRSLRLHRVASWGALGAAIVPLLGGADPRMLYLTAPLGALIATVSVVLARRAEPRPRGQA